MWDSVPWFTGGGAQHSPEVARLLAYAATQGSEGVVGIGDLAVKALSVPGGAVQVMPGAAVVRNRASGGSQQSYIARNPTADTVTITPTGSGAGRSDLVIARIEDPYVAGTSWQEPANPKIGPYIFSRVLSNVPASAIASPLAARRYLASQGVSGIPLAGVTLPASTGTVTSGMIKPLREMAMPRRQRDLKVVGVTNADTETLTNTTTDGEVFPNVAVWQTDIPDWATRVRIVATWSQVRVPPGNTNGHLWVHLGTLDTQKVLYDTPGSTNYARATYVCADDIAVPASLRGTTANVYTKAQIDYTSASSARLVVDGGTAAVIDLEYLEAPAEDAS